MLQKLFFFLTFFIAVFGVEDFFKFDYCTLNCPGEEHSSCHCKAKSDREEVLYELQGFRKKALDLHNYWRNQLAIGKDPTYIKGAKDMMALSYDLELEHCARCLAVAHFQGDHDHCRATKNKKKYGQNLTGCSQPSFTRDLFGKVIYNLDVDAVRMLSWWSEIKDVPDWKIVDKFYKSGVKIGHWTQWAWAFVDRIGCARVYTPHMKPKAAYNYGIICHYQSSLPSFATVASGNIIGRPIFKPGTACTECPDGTKCTNKEYEGLCGEILPLPTSNLTEIPKDTRSQSSKRNGSTFMVVFVSIITSLNVL